jgi:hypothetical protein
LFFEPFLMMHAAGAPPGWPEDGGAAAGAWRRATAARPDLAICGFAGAPGRRHAAGLGCVRQMSPHGEGYALMPAHAAGVRSARFPLARLRRAGGGMGRRTSPSRPRQGEPLAANLAASRRSSLSAGSRRRPRGTLRSPDDAVRRTPGTGPTRLWLENRPRQTTAFVVCMSKKIIRAWPDGRLRQPSHRPDAWGWMALWGGAGENRDRRGRGRSHGSSR